MRWFTDAAYEADDEAWDAMLADYDRHIAKIADRLPPDLAALASEPRLNLHDARIRTIEVKRNAGSVEMTVNLDADRTLRLTFSGATFDPDDLQAVAYAVGGTFATDHWGTTRTVIRAQEVDVADDGRYVMRLRLWPFHEFALIFDSFSLVESAEQRDDGRPGRFVFT